MFSLFIIPIGSGWQDSTIWNVEPDTNKMIADTSVHYILQSNETLDYNFIFNLTRPNGTEFTVKTYTGTFKKNDEPKYFSFIIEHEKINQTGEWLIELNDTNSPIYNSKRIYVDAPKGSKISIVLSVLAVAMFFIYIAFSLGDNDEDETVKEAGTSRIISSLKLFYFLLSEVFVIAVLFVSSEIVRESSLSHLSGFMNQLMLGSIFILLTTLFVFLAMYVKNAISKASEGP